MSAPDTPLGGIAAAFEVPSAAEPESVMGDLFDAPSLEDDVPLGDLFGPPEAGDLGALFDEIANYGYRVVPVRESTPPPPSPPPRPHVPLDQDEEAAEAFAERGLAGYLVGLAPGDCVFEPLRKGVKCLLVVGPLMYLSVGTEIAVLDIRSQKVVREMEAPGRGYFNIWGVCVVEDRLFAAAPHVVFEFNARTGMFVRRLEGTSKLRNARSMVLRDGLLYVGDCSPLARVHVFTLEGEHLRSFGALPKLNFLRLYTQYFPSGDKTIAVRGNEVFVRDEDFCAVTVYDGDTGDFLFLFGDKGEISPDYHVGMVVRDDLVFVASAEIVVFSAADGSVVTRILLKAGPMAFGDDGTLYTRPSYRNCIIPLKVFARGVAEAGHNIYRDRRSRRETIEQLHARYPPLRNVRMPVLEDLDGEVVERRWEPNACKVRVPAKDTVKRPEESLTDFLGRVEPVVIADLHGDTFKKDIRGRGFTIACVANELFIPRAGGILVMTRGGKVLRTVGAEHLELCAGVAVVGDRLFASDMSGEEFCCTIRVFRLDDGTLMERWRGNDALSDELGPIVAYEGRIFVGGRRIFELLPDGTCVRAGFGDVPRLGIHRHFSKYWIAKIGALAVSDDEVYVTDEHGGCPGAIFSAVDGEFLCLLDPDWDCLNLPTSMAARNGIVFVGDHSGVQVLTASDGTFLLSLRGEKETIVRGLCLSDDGVLYAVTDHQVLAYHVFSWNSDAESHRLSAPSKRQEVVAVLSLVARGKDGVARYPAAQFWRLPTELVELCLLL